MPNQQQLDPELIAAASITAESVAIMLQGDLDSIAAARRELRFVIATLEDLLGPESLEHYDLEPREIDLDGDWE